MKEIKSVLIDEEQVDLVKDKLGYRVVHPISNADGKINWVNFLFGGYNNLLRLSIYISIAILLLIGINELIGQYKLIADNPCKYCKNCFAFGKGGLKF